MMQRPGGDSGGEGEGAGGLLVDWSSMGARGCQCRPPELVDLPALRSAGDDAGCTVRRASVDVPEAVTAMDTSRSAIEQWLLLDGCRMPPRVFAIIDELLTVIERQEQVLTGSRAM